jgi:predicted transcriptional regulator
MTTGTAISTKELLTEFVRDLPEKITLAEAIEELQILEGIREGQRDVAEGRVISHEEMKRRIAEWRSK